MTNEQDIKKLNEMMEVIPFSKRELETVEIAIQALEKQQYFRNCKECSWYNADFEGCDKFHIEANAELDGCSFYEEV